MSIVEGKKWSPESLNDPEFSLLPDLKRRVKSSREIENHLYSLLKATLAAHHAYLEKLKKLEDEPWCNEDAVKDVVDAGLREIDEILSKFFSLSFP
jgi:hypothetical protein